MRRIFRLGDGIPSARDAHLPRMAYLCGMAKMTENEIAASLEENKRIYHEHFDPEYARAIVGNVLHILMDVYFRVRKVGFEEEEVARNNPKHPVILISNHSGMAFPWDGMIFMAYTLREKDYQVHEVPRPIIAPALSKIRLMNAFMIKNLWKRCAGIDASYLNFETMMHYPHANVMVFPEGVPGIGKGFNNRYQLQRFATSFVRLALKYQTDIIPFVTINGEYLNPFSFQVPWIDRLMQKVYIPFLPMGLHTPLLLLLPWMFYYSMPARLTYVRCRRIPVGELTDKKPEDMTEEDIIAARDHVRDSMQTDLNRLRQEYGKRPYQWRDLFRRVWENKQYFPFMFPMAWPLLFAEFERQWRRKERTGKDINMKPRWWSPLPYLLRNPITICYYIPIVGWIPLLIRGYFPLSNKARQQGS